MSVTSLQRVLLDDDGGELVPFKTVCATLGIHYNTGYRANRKGTFPLLVTEMGRRFFCKRADIEAFLAETRRPRPR